MPRDDARISIIIVGAGKAGELLASGIVKDRNSPFKVAGFVDDDKRKQGSSLKGLKVLGQTPELRKLIKKYDIQEIFIAIPSERGRVIREIVENTIGLKMVYKILPRLPEVLMQD